MISEIVRRVAQRAVSDRRALYPSLYWADFMLATSLIDVWSASGYRVYLDTARDIVDRYVERGPWWQEKRMWRWAGVTFPALRLYLITADSRYREFGLQTAEGLFKDPEKVRAGAIAPHLESAAHTWVDLVYFACPASSEAAVVSGDHSHFDPAVGLLELIASRLQDPQSGLFYPYWETETGDYPRVLWARGNGWVTVACVEVLTRLPQSHPRRDYVRETLMKQLEGLRQLQDPSGHWHTVLDRPDSYLETSATAIFGFAMARGVRCGLLSREWLEPAVRAWHALQDKVSHDGQVFGVSMGTQPGDLEHYLTIERGVAPYGTAFFLELGVEMNAL